MSNLYNAYANTRVLLFIFTFLVIYNVHILSVGGDFLFIGRFFI